MMANLSARPFPRWKQIGWIFFPFIALTGCTEKTDPSTHQTVFVKDLGEWFVHHDDRTSWYIEHSFQHFNDEPHPIELTLAGTTCGCASASFTPKIVKPGESATVCLRIALSCRRYRSVESVYFLTNSSRIPKLTFTLAADIFPALYPSPYFRQIVRPYGEAGLEPIEFDLIGYRPINAEAKDEFTIRHSIPHVTVTSGPMGYKSLGRIEKIRTPLKIVFDSKSAIAQNSISEGTLEVFVGNARYSMFLKFWRDLPVIAVPERLFLSNSKPAVEGKEILGSIRLVSEIEFNVRDISCDFDGIEWSRDDTTAAPTKQTFIVYLGKALRKVSDSPPELIFKLDLIEQPEIRVPILIFE